MKFSPPSEALRSALQGRQVEQDDASVELGDKDGHKFHGNQYKDEGEEDHSEADHKGKSEDNPKMILEKDHLERDSKRFNTLFNPSKEQRKEDPKLWDNKVKLKLAARVEALEMAVLALGRQEFGDHPGHVFHGNQWGTGAGGVTVHRHTDVSGVVDRVMRGGVKLGSISQAHEFLYAVAGNDKGFEARPVVGKRQEFDTADEAVKHILKETKAFRG